MIDYKACRFEKEVRDVDVVFDAVGSETLERSWGVLKANGRMITIAADSEGTSEERVKDAFFIVEPNQKRQNYRSSERGFGRVQSSSQRQRRIREDCHHRSSLILASIKRVRVRASQLPRVCPQ